MSDFLKDLYYRIPFGYSLIVRLNSLFRFIRYGLISTKTRLKNRFKARLGYTLDLENPKTLNAKIQWLKIHDRKDLYTKLADKYEVRSYVIDIIGEEYLIPLVFNTRSINDLKPENFPDYPVIVKANHNSSGGIIIRDKKEVDWEYIRRKMYSNLFKDHYPSSREWQYKNIVPQIIVEKLLITKDDSIPEDYKFHCFNGKVEIIQVDLDRHSNHSRVLYTKDWEFIDFQWEYKKGYEIDPPINLVKMIFLAEELSKNLIFVRVDFYNIEGEIYFGEMTFHPGSGFENFIPSKYDLLYGSKLKLD